MKTATLKIAQYARRYARVVYWSDEDNCYVGSLPEICGACCHGDDESSVYKQLDEIAIDLVKDKFDGTDMGTIPEPGNISFITKSRFNSSVNNDNSISKLRKSLNFNQADFALVLGVTLSTVAKWEQGRRKPDGAAARLLQIAEKHPQLLTESV